MRYTPSHIANQTLTSDFQNGVGQSFSKDKKVVSGRSGHSERAQAENRAGQALWGVFALPLLQLSQHQPLSPWAALDRQMASIWPVTLLPPPVLAAQGHRGTGCQLWLHTAPPLPQFLSWLLKRGQPGGPLAFILLPPGLGHLVSELPHPVR